MSYRHIENLYKNKEILLFKECWASEKIHGTSTHVSWNNKTQELHIFNGGANRNLFLANFNQDLLIEQFKQNAIEHPDVDKITIYGEGYGNTLQKMSHTYGKELRFIAFEVLIIRGDIRFWLSPPDAEKIAIKFGQEFVPYRLIKCDIDTINAEMYRDSEVATRRGCGSGHMREGVVLRPPIELIHPNGGRIISKHKRPEFMEKSTKSINPEDPELLKLIEEAQEVVDEYCVPMRLIHVLDNFNNPQMEDMQKIIKAMIEDIIREEGDHIVQSKQLNKLIGKQTAKLFKNYLIGQLKENT